MLLRSKSDVRDIRFRCPGGVDMTATAASSKPGRKIRRVEDAHESNPTRTDRGPSDDIHEAFQGSDIVLVRIVGIARDPRKTLLSASLQPPPRPRAHHNLACCQVGARVRDADDIQKVWSTSRPGRNSKRRPKTSTRNRPKKYALPYTLLCGF
jgi:hypothetical protein